MNSYFLKIFAIVMAGLALVFFLLASNRDAVAFPLRQASTPSQTLATPTIVETRSPTPTPQSTMSAQANSTPELESSVYVVKVGDNLWAIATKVYGNGSQYVLIQKANNLPNNAVLQVGSTLIIPPTLLPTRSAPASTSAQPLTLTTTPLATTTNAPSPTPVRTMETATPLALAVIPSSSVNSVSHSTQFSWAPLIPYIQIALNVLSALCLIGSSFCLFLALESYQRSSPYIRRRRIGSRVRSGL